MSGSELPPLQFEPSRDGPGRGGKTRIGAGDCDDDEFPGWGFEFDESERYKPQAVICERNPYLRDATETMLVRFASKVMQTDSGVVALQLINSFRPGLLITDVDVNGLSGLDLCRKAKRIWPSLKILISTDLYHATKYFNRLCNSGISGICLKKRGFRDLVPAMEALFQQQGPFHSTELLQLVHQDYNSSVLNSREVDVLVRLSQQINDVSEELGISVADARLLLKSLSNKLKKRTAAEVFDEATRLGFVPLPVIPSRNQHGETEEDEAMEAARDVLERGWG